jgi:hypothetical protein
VLEFLVGHRRSRCAVQKNPAVSGR